MSSLSWTSRVTASAMLLTVFCVARTSRANASRSPACAAIKSVARMGVNVADGIGRSGLSMDVDPETHQRDGCDNARVAFPLSRNWISTGLPDRACCGRAPAIGPSRPPMHSESTDEKKQVEKQADEQEEAQVQENLKEQSGSGFSLSGEEHDKVEDNSPPRAAVLHEIIRRNGREELARGTAALAWSSLAAGLSMGFSFLARAVLHRYVQEVPA